MNQSVKDLVDRGYNIDEVTSLVFCDDDVVDYISDIIFERDSKGCEQSEQPVAVFVGGQPGSGKSVMSMHLKSKHPDFMEIAMDNYRMYHPDYKRIEEVIEDHWISRETKENDTPGNDIAAFTHVFSGRVSDIMIEKAALEKKNMIIEWNMREPKGPLETMERLKSKGYKILTVIIGVSKNTSEEAYKKRADIMNDGERLMRRVSERFHNGCIQDLPQSVDILKKRGVDTGIIDQMLIVNRNEELLWDNTHHISPGKLLSYVVNGDYYQSDNDYSYALVSREKECEGFHVVNGLHKASINAK